MGRRSRLKVNENGRVVIPVAYRKALGRQAAKKWTMPVKNWSEALNYFTILWPELSIQGVGSSPLARYASGASPTQSDKISRRLPGLVA
jgi:hypothetical protein